MEDQYLSPHFKLSEFVNSPTAKAHKIDNTPSEQVIQNLKRLCEEVLEPLRVAIDKPIVIGSGYRCKALNDAVGGVKTSNHLTGCAADIHLNSTAEGREWFKWIEDNCQFDELIWETADKKHYWIHVAFRPSGSSGKHVESNRHKVISFLLKSNSKSR